MNTEKQNSNRPELFNKSYQKEWSKEYKYKHIHTREYCTFETNVAEFLVIRRSEKLNLGKPSYKFWTKGDPLHWIWQKQHRAAMSLKKKYGEEAILSAIKSKDFDKLLVIGIQNGRGWKINPPAEEVIKKHYDIIKNKLEVDTQPSGDIIECPQPELKTRSKRGYGKKSSISKLRGLQDGKEESN